MGESKDCAEVWVKVLRISCYQYDFRQIPVSGMSQELGTASQNDENMKRGEDHFDLLLF